MVFKYEEILLRIITCTFGLLPIKQCSHDLVSHLKDCYGVSYQVQKSFQKTIYSCEKCTLNLLGLCLYV